MKVWLVSHAYNTWVAHDKLLALAALPGMDLTLMAPRQWRSAFGMMKMPPGPWPYRVVTAPVAINGRIGGYFFRDWLLTMRRARPEVIHADVEPWSLVAVQCLLAGRGAPVIVFTWENLHGPRLWQRALERFMLRRVAFVIAGNQAARDRMLRRGVPAARLTVLPQFGVDPARYARGDPARVRMPLTVAPPRPNPVIGYVGRLVPEKGVDVLIDALAGSGLGARLLVVGDGGERPALERRAAERGVAAHFAGAVADADVPHYLAAMNVLVLPSRTTDRWAEQFGHVLIEAMAAGVPVIGSSSGAIPEVLGDVGLLFPEGEVETLRERLVRLLGDEDLRRALVRRARVRVEACYTHGVIARALGDIYARILRA